MVGPETSGADALRQSTCAHAGCAMGVDPDSKLLGIFTDGDLRRKLLDDGSLLKRSVQSVMTGSPRAALRDAPAVEALALMQEHRIGEMPVLNKDGKAVGMIDLKGLIAAGLT